MGIPSAMLMWGERYGLPRSEVKDCLVGRIELKVSAHRNSFGVHARKVACRGALQELARLGKDYEMCSSAAFIRFAKLLP